MVRGSGLARIPCTRIVNVRRPICVSVASQSCLRGVDAGRKEVYMNSQQNDNQTSQLIEQIERQSEIIAYLLRKNELLRSRLYDVERPAEGD
jgi:hypothetical protein